MRPECKRMIEVIWKGDKKALKELIEVYNCDVNEPVDQQGNYPLHYASGSLNEMKGLEIVELLVEKGADVNVKNRNGHTPLHVASDRGNMKTVQYLIEHGADVWAKDNSGKTPLYYAIMRNFKPLAFYLLDIMTKEKNSGALEENKKVAMY